ncbi:hypothetical protein EHP00_876 [Ecytonucleospora hepatopenaei]|uniref:Uncharacterized protein n=1 Tax=Ecytonucleospora hepatopenaei TaxID=646526 RepID=A0A1W0E401_9MICR|nr:hypothetical protein EHP00_876 [Ecytonucleospora hepatopenaei]
MFIFITLLYKMIFSLFSNSCIFYIIYIINILCTNSNNNNNNNNNNNDNNIYYTSTTTTNINSFSLFCKVPNEIIAIPKCYKTIKNILDKPYDHLNCKDKKDKNVKEKLNSLNNDFNLLHECLLKVVNFISKTPYERIRQSDIKIIEEYFNIYIDIIHKIIIMVRNNYVDHYTSLPSNKPDDDIILEADFTYTQFKVLHDIFVFLNSLLKINIRGKFKYLSSSFFIRYHMRYYKVLKYLYDRKNIV